MAHRFFSYTAVSLSHRMTAQWLNLVKCVNYIGIITNFVIVQDKSRYDH